MKHLYFKPFKCLCKIKVINKYIAGWERKFLRWDSNWQVLGYWSDIVLFIWPSCLTNKSMNNLSLLTQSLGQTPEGTISWMFYVVSTFITRCYCMKCKVDFVSRQTFWNLSGRIYKEFTNNFIIFLFLKVYIFRN